VPRNATADEVEKVMGFCTREERAEFLRRAPQFDDVLASGGISLPKLWFSVSPAEQRTRFAMRQVDPFRQWKLSPTDIESLNKWDGLAVPPEHGVPLDLTARTSVATAVVGC
jgi:polyphosphate kinase